MSLKNVRIFNKIPQKDEDVLRNLFKKFSNGLSSFTKYSKLEGKYSL